jgi:hypothetical protein
MWAANCHCLLPLLLLYLRDASRVSLQPQQLLPGAHIKQPYAPAVAASSKKVRLKGVECQAADDACTAHSQQHSTAAVAT